MSNPMHNSLPRKPAKKKSQSTGQAQFINYTLNKDERAACKAWLPTLDEMDNAALRLAEEGYKCSLKWDDFSSSFAAFVTASDPTNPNAAFILSGRGSTPLKALKQAMYLHWYVTEGNWAIAYRPPQRDELDD